MRNDREGCPLHGKQVNAIACDFAEIHFSNIMVLMCVQSLCRFVAWSVCGSLSLPWHRQLSHRLSLWFCLFIIYPYIITAMFSRAERCPFIRPAGHYRSGHPTHDRAKGEAAAPHERYDRRYCRKRPIDPLMAPLASRLWRKAKRPNE
jgi:hypothetical protein